MMITTATVQAPSTPWASRAAKPEAGPAERFEFTGRTECFPRLQDMLAASRAAEPLPLTLNDVQGPYYRDNAPVRTDLFPGGEQGQRVEYTFRVTDPSGQPVNARIDVWTADDTGVYDMESPVFRGRAQQSQHGEEGASFSAIKPGNYYIGEDAEGNKLYRPAHVHVKIHVPGNETLTTQLYFPGDQWNNLDPILDPEDRGGRGFDPSLLMTETSDGSFTYQFVVPGER